MSLYDCEEIEVAVDRLHEWILYRNVEFGESSNLLPNDDTYNTKNDPKQTGEITHSLNFIIRMSEFFAIVVYVFYRLMYNFFLIQIETLNIIIILCKKSLAMFIKVGHVEITTVS